MLDIAQWEPFVRIGGALIGLIASVVGVFKLVKRPRAKLAADLDILKQLQDVKSNEENHKLVQARVNSWVQEIYDPDKPPVHKFTVAFGSMVLLVSGFWAVWVSLDGFRAMSILYGYVAMLGIGIILNGIGAKRTQQMFEKLGLDEGTRQTSEGSKPLKAPRKKRDAADTN